MATDIFPLEVWTSQITQASVPANENALRVQVLEQPAASILSAQPASPAEDDMHVLGAAPSGAQWSSFSEGDVAIYKGGTWLAFSPFEGWVKSIGTTLYQYTSGAWTVFTVPGEAAPPQIVSVSASTTLTKSLHAGKFIEAAHASTPIVLTVATDAAQSWDAATEIHIRQAGAAAVSVVGDTGVTLQVSPSLSLALAEQYAVLTLKRVAADTWAVFGYLAAV